MRVLEYQHKFALPTQLYTVRFVRHHQIPEIMLSACVAAFRASDYIFFAALPPHTQKSPSRLLWFHMIFTHIVSKTLDSGVPAPAH